MQNTTQPEAIRLADELDAYHTRACHKQAAAELRRLHARVVEPSAQGPAVPSGWKLVPVEPTQGMLSAATYNVIKDFDDLDAQDAWTAMLAAAPQPEACGWQDNVVEKYKD